ncbi:hypothetical protein Pmani_036811 [Petrolisthes manimaculis]|uniref:Uncharacterized protein n=1 Tax=Petrolisthes manimaculis TaxID=1843537 RepID=A0AAE1NHL6_9EUCA|nr:hypothetical protein Pmani_036811 [Petrolisthes manimaculis]
MLTGKEKDRRKEEMMAGNYRVKGRQGKLGDVGRELGKEKDRGKRGDVGREVRKKGGRGTEGRMAGRQDISETDDRGMGTKSHEIRPPWMFLQCGGTNKTVAAAVHPRTHAV